MDTGVPEKLSFNFRTFPLHWSLGVIEMSPETKVGDTSPSSHLQVESMAVVKTNLAFATTWWLRQLSTMDSSAMDISPPRRMSKKRSHSDEEDDSQQIETARPAVRRLMIRSRAQTNCELYLETARYRTRVPFAAISTRARGGLRRPEQERTGSKWVEIYR